MTKLTVSLTLYFLALMMFFGCQPESDSDLNPSVNDLDSELSTVRELIYSDPQTALSEADDIIVEAELIGAKLQSGKAKWYKGFIYDELLQDVSQAYYNYNEALKDLDGSDDYELLSKVYMNLGTIYDFYGEYDRAIENYSQAISLEDGLSKENLSDIYYNYAFALQRKGDEESFFAAEEAYGQSIDLAKEVDYHENIALVHNQIGMMYKAVNDYDMARISYRNIIRNYQSNEDLSQYVGLAYQGIGETHLEEGNTDEAIDFFERALVYKTNSGSIFFTKFSLGTAMMKVGQQEEAIRVWKDALNEKHDKTNPEQVQIYAELTQALANVGQFKEALNFSQVYNSSMKEILEQKKYESNNQVLFADIVREYEEFRNTEPFYAQWWFVITAVLLISGLALFFTYWYQKNKSKLSAAQLARLRNEFQQLKVD